MGKLLNNKYAVIGLVLAAACVFYFRAVQPALDYFYPEQFELDIASMEEFEESINAAPLNNATENPIRDLQFASEQFSLTQIDISSLRWNEESQRDPFTRIKQSLDVLPDPVTGPSRILEVDDSRLPRVSAIVNAPTLKFAVIEGEILSEGDQYKNFVLKRIENNQVSVVQFPQQQWHRLSVTE